MCPPASLSTSTSVSAPNPPIASKIVPKNEICEEAYAHASSLLHPSILNHSIRVYSYATVLASHSNSPYMLSAHKHALLFVACLFHDIGTTSTYDGPARFEVEGADAAVQFLSRFGAEEKDKHDVWTAIAVHTTPQIAERIGELAQLVRLAVITDFGRRTEVWNELEPLRAGLEAEFERGGIEKVLGDAVVEQAIKRPDKAPKVSWPRVMYEAHLEEPEWEGVNKAF
jgi:HD superfamily phosphohydrolase YqeK